MDSSIVGQSGSSRLNRKNRTLQGFAWFLLPLVAFAGPALADGPETPDLPDLPQGVEPPLLFGSNPPPEPAPEPGPGFAPEPASGSGGQGGEGSSGSPPEGSGPGIQSGSITITDHTMAKSVQETSPWLPNDRTYYFDTAYSRIFSWVQFDINGNGVLSWEWSDSNGVFVPQNSPCQVNINHNGWWRQYCYIEGYALRGPLTVKVFWDGALKLTETNPNNGEKPEVNPYILQQYTCSNRNSPSTSQQTSFNRDANHVCLYQRFSVDNAASTHTIRCRFIDPSNQLYSESADTALPIGGPGTYAEWTCSIDIANQIAANRPGTWKAVTWIDQGAEGKTVNFDIVNRAPSTPGAPTGPTSGFRLESKQFCASTTDVDGDQIQYEFDWGDGATSGWGSLVASGGNSCASHAWSSIGGKTVRVRAKDSFGATTGYSAGATIQINQETPSAPRSPTAARGDAPGEIDLTWQAPLTNGQSALTGYKVYESTASGGAQTEVASLGVVTSWTRLNVPNGATRFYKIAAVNTQGVGTQSTEVSAAAPDVPAAPLAFDAARGDAAGEIDLRWDPPNSNGGLAISTYKVYRGTTSSNLAFHRDVGLVNSWTDTGLANGATYFYSVLARNAAGDGAQSNQDSATAPNVPNAPGAFNAERGDEPNEITLSWNTPTDNGGLAITKYKIYRGTACTSLTFLAEVNAPATSYSDKTVPTGATRCYDVSAVNGAGEGARSAQDSATAPDVPGAPQNLVAAQGNAPRTLDLTWSTPANDGGLPITGYKVYRGTSCGSIGTTPVATLGVVTSWSDTSAALADNTTYCYKVAATNAAGTGGQSNADDAKTAGVPHPARNLVAVRGDAPGEIDLDWDAPAQDGGLAVTGYRIWARSETGPWVEVGTTGASQTLFTHTGLPNGAHRFYHVKAENAVGLSNPSNEDDAFAPDVPSPPTQLGAETGPDVGQIRITWVVPTDNGGLPILDYTVEIGTASGRTDQVVTGVTGTSFTHSGLSPGAVRWFRVAARNAAGTSQDSNEASARAPDYPTPPTNFQLKPGQFIGSAQLTWGPPVDDGGLPVLEYRVRRTTVSSGESVLIKTTQMSLLDKDLVPGLRYYYTVTAFNKVGEKNPTAEKNVRTTVLHPADDPDGDLVFNSLEDDVCKPDGPIALILRTQEAIGAPLGKCSPDGVDYDPTYGTDRDDDYAPDAAEPAMCATLRQVAAQNPQAARALGICVADNYGPPPEKLPASLFG